MEKHKLNPMEKALLILETLAESPYEFRSIDVSKLTGMNKTTVYRILYNLLEENWVIKDRESGKYKVGPMAYHVGTSYVQNNNAEGHILDILNELAQKTKESVGYAVREGNKIISLYEVEIHQPFRMRYRPGQFYPMNRGCYGKCLMAYHDEAEVKKLLAAETFEKIQPGTLTTPAEILDEYEKIRSLGYVISDEETTPFGVGVGVPVFNKKGQVEGCVAVAFMAPDPKEKAARIREFTEILKAGALEIGRCLV